MDDAHETGSGLPPIYQVTAERHDKGWRVHIEDDDGRVAEAQAHSLDDVETAAWDHMASCSEDRRPGQLHVEVRLPPEIRKRLDVIERLRDDVTRELETAVLDMIKARFPDRDIDYLIGEHGRVVLGRQRVVVTNADIARHGLAEHPDAVGVSWDDHGHFATLTCRSCVEINRDEYAELPPEGENVLVYDETDLYCDRCEQDIVPVRRSWTVR